MIEPAPSHLLLADGDERLRGLLRQYLHKHGFLVSLARDTGHARRLLAGLEFDLVLIDAQLAEAAALAEALDAPLLLLTAPGQPATGPYPHLGKPFEPKLLLDKIDALLARSPAPEPPAPKTLGFGDLSFDPESGLLLRDRVPVRLTATEIELLRILSIRPGEPVSRDELVARLSGSGPGSKARAVDVQITRLRRKLEDDPKMPRHLQTVRGSGYMLVSG